MLLMMASAAHALNVEKSWKIVSPDKKTEVTVGTVNNIWLYWCIGHNGISVLERSGMNVMVDGAYDVFHDANKKSGVGKATNKVQVRTQFATPFYKKAVVKDEYNGMTVSFKNGISVEFRVYNDGAAYRFLLRQQGR